MMPKGDHSCFGNFPAHLMPGYNLPRPGGRRGLAREGMRGSRCVQVENNMRQTILGVDFVCNLCCVPLPKEKGPWKRVSG